MPFDRAFAPIEHRGKEHAQLVDLTDREPEHISELCVGDLVPEKDRSTVWAVSSYRMKQPELARFSEKRDEIVGWFKGRERHVPGP